MTTDTGDLYNVPMPTSTTRRPVPKLAASRSVAAAEAAVAACKDALEVAETFLAWVSTAEQVASQAEANARSSAKTSVVYAQTDITQELGQPRQTTQKQYATGKYPRPDLLTPAGRPLWFPETLRNAGILPASSRHHPPGRPHSGTDSTLATDPAPPAE